MKESPLINLSEQKVISGSLLLRVSEVISYLHTTKKISCLLIILLSLFFDLKTVSGQISTLNAWSNLYHGTSTSTQNITYSIPNGSNVRRVLVVAIATSRTATGSRTVTLTYGGQTLTSESGDMSSTTPRQHTQIYYLNEAGIDAATNTTLSVTVSGGITAITDVYAAVFENINQTSPITDSQNYNSGTSTTSSPQFGTALTLNTNDQAVKIVSSVRTGSIYPRTITDYGTNWTGGNEETGSYNTSPNSGDLGIINGAAMRSIPSSNTTDASTVTFSNTSLASMTAISLKEAPKYFRSKATGNWNAMTTWQQSYDNSIWMDATSIPISTDNLVNIQDGNTVTLTGAASVNSITINGTFDLGTYALAGTNTITVSPTGSLLVGGSSNFPTGFSTTILSSGSTVNYDNSGAQTISNQTYSNLTLSGNGAKTTTGTTVNGILSMEGTATTTGTAPTYGSAATLQYQGTALQTTGSEFPSGFSGSGGVIIDNTNGVNLDIPHSISCPLVLNSGALNLNGKTFTIDIAGSYSCGGSGTINGNAGSAFVINGTTATNLPPGIYQNLTINRSGGVSLCGNTTVNGTLTLTSGAFAVGAYTLTLNGPAIAGTPANLVTTTSSSLVFGGTTPGLTLPSSVTNLNNLTLNNANGLALNNPVSVAGTLTLTNGNLTLGNNDLTLSNPVSGTFDNTHMIVINGTGSLVKKGAANADFVMTYPVGTGTSYTPVQISSLSATTIAPASTIKIQSFASASSGISGNYPLNRHWMTSSTGISGSVLVNIGLTYDEAADIPSGGNASLYEILYKPAAGSWSKPNGSGAAGSNPLTASSATTLNAEWSASVPVRRAFYTLKTGSWDDPATWTLDPSGALPLNPGNLTPTTSPTSVNDDITVLSGRTVTVPTGAKVNNNLTVIGTLDLGTTTGHGFTNINGTGKIRLAGDNFPAGDATDFISAGQGEGTVEYYGVSRTTTPPHAFFNVIVDMTTGNVLTLISNLTLNGGLTVSNGTLSINNNTSTTPLTINVNGDIKVAATGKIITGTANARHQLNIYGNFTNNGEVLFTNRVAANYAAEATDGIVDANFLNTAMNQSVFCDGVSNFYRIEIDKGIDDTYTLNLDATAPANFNLFGFANEDHAAGGAQLVANNNALGLIHGTVRIGNSIVIPVLSTANIYNVSQGARLWINEGTVQKNSGQSIAVYGKIKITTGLLEAKVTSGISLALNGTFSADGGIVNLNQLRTSDGASNNGAYIQSGGNVNVLGGTTNSDFYVFSLLSTASVFNMSGGTLKVNTATGNGAILINSDPDNIKVTGGTVIAETASTQDFIITSRAPFWDLVFKNSTAIARQFSLGAASDIGPDNISITVQNLQVLNNFRVWGQESGGSSYPAITFDAALKDVSIGGSFYLERGAKYVAVTGGTSPYDATGDQPTARNTTYFIKTTGTTPVEEFYIGEPVSQLELGNFVVDRTSGYEVKLTSGGSRVNESVAVDVNGTASVLSGIFNQNLYTLRTWGAIVNNGRMGTWVAGTTPSRAQIQMVENPALTITTSTGAVFGNIQVNVTPPSEIILTSDIYVERLEYVKGLIYLKSYNLRVDNLWNMATGLFENSSSNSLLKLANSSYSGSSMIYTDGKASDGGLSLKVTANSATENQNNILNNFGPITYPVGFTSDGGTTLYFRPAQLVVKNFANEGYITIRPVFGPLQTTNQTGSTEVLQHYWRVSNSGFTTLPTVAYRFYYRNQTGTTNLDLPAGAINEASYVPGKVLDQSPYTRLYEPLTDNDVVKAFGAGSNSRAITINGSSTNGLFSPSSTGITLENANYTTGMSTRFTGSVKIFYSRDLANYDSGMGSPWNQAASWTRSDLLNVAYSPHDSRQPASTTIPGSGDVAVIGWVPWNDSKTTLRGQPHCIWLTDNQSVAELVFTKMTDASGNPVARVYRSNFQFRPTLTINGNGDNNIYDSDYLADNGKLTAKLVKGEGLFWNRQSDPDYTIMDIGDFARQDSSYVIYENFTNGRIINNTPALFPNIYISNDGWGANDKDFTFAKDITTTGNVELLGNVNLVLPQAATGNFVVGRNLVMFENDNKGGGAEVAFGNAGTARKIIIKGDLLMYNSNSVVHVRTPNATAPLVDHELHIEGNIYQGTTGLSSTGLVLWTGATNDRITLYLEGTNNMTYKLVNGTIPAFYRIVTNKGSSKATTVQFDSDFTLNGPTSGVGVAKALELQNGTFIYNNSNAARILSLSSGNDFFSIPSTSGLEIKQGTVRVSGNSGISLDGTLTVSGGTLNMTGSENTIEYSASGSATLTVSSGNLNVGGQIRRSTTSNAGILIYNQSGGSVVVGQNAATASSRGVFEILNTGSSFNMSAGDLYIVRSQTGPTISAFYFNPDTYNIGLAANIHIGHSLTPANQTFGIYAGKPLPNLRVNNESLNNPIAKLEVTPATITSLLSIDPGATFNANGLDLNLQGDMDCFGAFNPNGNTTYLSGSSTQTLTGNGTAINFFNLDKTGSNNVILNGANTPLLVLNELSLRAGTFTTSSNNVTVKGDVLNDAAHIYGGAGDGIILNGTTSQTLTGNGTFGKLTVNNPNGINLPVANQFKITNSLKMLAGVINIGKNMLDFGVNALIEQASPFSLSNMITTDISFTDNGVRKTFPAGPQPDFIFPVGSTNKYTPVTLSITANGNSTGKITVKPANEIHPSIVEDTETGAQIVDANNALQYYWTLVSNGISGFAGTASMKYFDTDAKVTSPYTVADYFTASILSNGLGNWLKFPNKADFDELNKNLIFHFTSTDDSQISGDYTAGAGDVSLNGAIPDNVARYETNANGDWTNNTIWTPNVTGGPRGAIAKINQPHTVDVTTNYLSGYMTQLYGKLKINSTFGHRLGILTGTGTLYNESGDIPAAVYDNFFSSAGGTVEFGGSAKDYEFLGNVMEVNHLLLSGSGERHFPNNNLILNGNLTFSGDAGLNAINYYNRKLTVKGNILRVSGGYNAGTGPNATVSMAGTLPQTITGSFPNENAFNNLEVNNPNDITIQNDVEVNRELLLTNGLISTVSGSLFRINYEGFVTPANGTQFSFVNGVLTKEMLTGNSFTFPVGNYNSQKNPGPISLQNISGPIGLNDWSVSYFYADPSLAGYPTANFANPITTVSKSEYWKIQAPSGGQSLISIILDGSSDVGSTIPDMNNLRIVGWNSSTSKWEIVGGSSTISGTNTNGTITTNSAVDYNSYTFFTIASTTPLSLSSASFTSPSVVNLCSGTSTTMVVALSGSAPWSLTYKIGSTPVTVTGITASPYNITVTPASTISYTLTGVTANGTPGIPGTVNGVTVVTVNVSPIPTVVITSNDADNTFCQNQSGGITFTATAGLANYNFRVNGITVQNGAGNTYQTLTLSPGVQSVDVIGTNSGNCSSTSSSIALTVNPLPDAAGAITGPASVCNNTSKSFSINSITNATSYVWKVDGITQTSTTTSMTYTFNTPGTSVVTVSGANPCGNGASSTLSVAVNTSSTVGAIGAITGSAGICKGGTGYTYQVGLVTNATSYIWSYTGTGATINGTTNSVTVDFSAGATNGNLTVAGTNGCSTNSPPSSYAITANTPPTASILPASPSTCSSAALNITATPSGGTTPYTTHLWTGTGAASLSNTGITNPSFYNATGGFYDLTYTVTDTKGCNGSANTTVQVFQAPVAYAGTAISTCTGVSPITMTGATAGGSFTGNPVWSGTGGAWTQNPDPALATFTPSTTTGTTTATLTLTGSNGCGNATSTRTITWNSVPAQPGVIAGTTTQCPGLTGQVYSITAVPNTDSYNWIVPTGWSITGGTGTNSITVTTGSAGQNGNITVSASNSCGSGAVKTLAVTVSQASVGGAVASPQTICSGLSPANLTLSGQTGTVLKWQKSSDAAFTSPTDIAVTSTTLTGATIGSLTSSTYFRALVQSSICSSAYSAAVLVTVTPTVTINAFSPATSTRCQGAGTVTTTTTANNSTGITYSLDATTAAFAGNSIDAATGAATYAAGWSGTTTITASAAGCNGPATTNLTVTTTPTVTINAFSPATSTRCQGAGTVTTTTTANNSTGITYALDATTAAFAGNSIVAGTGAVTYAAGWSGTTTITATATGCNGPATTTHVVTTTPTVTINAFTPATSTRCQGAGTVTYTTSASNFTGITYALDATTAAFNGNSIVAATGAVTYAAGWSGTTTITASAAGCNGPATTTHVVTTTPTVTINAFTPATSTRCQGAGTVTYTTSASNSTGITYALDATTAAFAGNSIVAGTGAVTYAAGWSGTTTITASAAGCNGPATSTHVVTIYAPPTANAGTAISVCSNAGGSNITAGASTTNSTSIAWTSSGTGTFANPNSLTTCLYTPSTADITAGSVILTLTATGNSPCGSATSTKTMTIKLDGSWIGGGNDWNTGTNWACGTLPTLASDVVVANGNTPYPILSTSPVGTTRNLTIGSSATVEISGGAKLQIAGTVNIASSGPITASAGTIEMEGSAAQTIPANTFAGNNLQDLVISNAAGVSLGGPLNLTGILTAVTGNLASDGNLTLISSAAQTALIDGSGGGQVTGSVTMQRYLASGGYKYISSPFSNATVSQISGLSTTATIPTFYAYNENHKTGSGADMSGWTPYPSGILGQMSGYSANMGAIGSAKTISLNGTVNNGNYSATLYNHNQTYTQGFNLIGNPYPSPIDWTTIDLTGTNIDNAIYFFNASGASDEYSGTYNSWVGGVSTGGSTNIIPSMQGFFVHVHSTGSGTLGMTNSVRTNDLNPAFKAATIDPRPILRFTTAFEEKNSISDPFVLYFDPQTTVNFDKEKDALKLMNTDLTVPNLYAVTPDARKLSIDGMPSPTDSTTSIPLGINILKDDWINFTATDISKLPYDLNLYLLDKEKNSTQDLRKNPTYRFFLQTGEYNQRFALLFAKTNGIIEPAHSYNLFAITQTNGTVMVKINLPDNEPGTLYVSNLLGQIILEKAVSNLQTVDISTGVNSGVYVVTMTAGERTQSEKTLIRKR